MNAAATLAVPSPGWGRRAWVLWLGAAFSAPAAAVWAALGGLLALLGQGGLVLAMIVTYAGVFGLVEVLYLPVRLPGSSWQVPASWIRGRTPAARAAIWGATLGSGLPTRNPYAGMWLGVLMLALASDARHGVLLGGLFGGVHGLSRALATLASIQRPAANAHLVCV